MMESIVLTLASNGRYFPGLYCAVASALSRLDAAKQLDLKVLDASISQKSKDTLSRLIDDNSRRMSCGQNRRAPLKDFRQRTGAPS
jgi:hypothetical protein